MAVVLSIAGSDPTGGAGVQADLQTIASLGAHGAAVITSVTVQDTHAVRAARHLPPELVGEQLACLLDDVAVAAAKTGMLGSAGVVEVVAEALAARPNIPLVVDPVVTASSGPPLLDGAGIETLREALIPRATIVTPNLREAELLTGLQVRSAEDMESCARALFDLGASAALVTGGHLLGPPMDVLYAGGEVVKLAGERVELGAAVHGTGCALSAALATFLARGEPLSAAAARAKAFVAAGMRAARHVGSGSLVIDFAAAAAAVRS